MKISEFKIGDKVYLREFARDEYFVLEIGHVRDQDGDVRSLDHTDVEEIEGWQYWTPPEEKRKPETWYRFEWKVKGQDPVTTDEWFRSKEDLRQAHVVGIAYDVEPRAYEEREF